MSNLYFGEREFGLKPRTEHEIDSNVWGGLVALINNLIDEEYFAQAFPERCLDYPKSYDQIYTTNDSRMKSAIWGHFDNFKFPLTELDTPLTILLTKLDTPLTLTILEFIEFCHEHISKPVKFDDHSYYQHHHLSFDKQEGQKEFRDQVNRLFQRNGIAFELQEDGQIDRLAPPLLRDKLNNSIFQTNDEILNSLLETARMKYLNPDFNVRKESLEKLWDAWQRIKTLDDPNPTKSIPIRLEKVSNQTEMRKVLNDDGKELTDIGNKFMIRHTEVGKIPITSSSQVDYLFNRLFGLIYIFLGDKIGKKSDLTVKQEIREDKVIDELEF
jgi:hypothetical protein